MKLVDFYLFIAQHALADLQACTDSIALGDDGYSKHFQYALICSVFSALSVEHAIQELIWVRSFFQTPKPYRKPALLQAAQMRNIPQKLEFIKATTKLSDSILRDMKTLFEYRNSIVHAAIKPFEDYVLNPESVQRIIEKGRGPDLDRAIELSMKKNSDKTLKTLAREFGTQASYLTSPSLGTNDLGQAEKNLRIAEASVQAIAQELQSTDWRLSHFEKSKKPKSHSRKK